MNREIELIKENCTYKLFLIELLKSFEEINKNVKDPDFKRYIKQLEEAIKQILELRDDNKRLKDISKIFDKEDNDE